MNKNDKIKKIYLIAVLFVGAIGLGLGSTFAMFNFVSTIDNPITFNTDLNSTNSLSETIEVVIPAGEEKNVDIVISNTYSGNLNYAVWHTPSNDLEVGSESSSNSYGPAGSLPSSGNFTLTVELRNNSSSSMSVTIGVSSSADSIVLPNGVTQVPGVKLIS